MLAKRIIPCLDIRDGRTVKGVNFVGIRDAGDPVELAARYAREGADELVFLDITATHEERKTFPDLVRKIALQLNIPFTVGGGINSFEDAVMLLEAGADKISLNSAAVRDPTLIDRLARDFGSQFVVLAIDAKIGHKGTGAQGHKGTGAQGHKGTRAQGHKERPRRGVRRTPVIPTTHFNPTTPVEVYINGGRIATGRDLFEWAREGQERGCGEILYTSMDHDGTKNGYANNELALLSEKLRIPIIASGGAGCPEHFRDAFVIGKADAALAASVFHFGEIPIPDLKEYLYREGIPVRL
jgi:cyclase